MNHKKEIKRLRMQLIALAIVVGGMCYIIREQHHAIQALTEASQEHTRTLEGVTAFLARVPLR